MRPNQSELLASVFAKIAQCKSHEEIYQLGVKYRKGEISDYPHKADSHEASLAAFECFRSAMSQGCKKPGVYHNIGMLYYKWKKYEDAESSFFIASEMGLEASKQNLKKIRREKAAREAEFNKSHERANLLALKLSQQALKIFDDLLSPDQLSEILEVSMGKALTASGLNIDEKTREKFLQATVQASRNNYETQLRPEIDKAKTDTRQLFGDLFAQDPHRVERSYRTMNTAKSYSSEEIAASLLSESQLEELFRVTQCIYENTQEGDCVLFLGRSPLLPYEMFSALELPRQTLCIPYSGGTKLNSTRMLEIPEENFFEYKEFLRTRGLTENFFAKYNRLVIVDRVESGKSVLFFRNLLGEINELFSRSPIIGFGDRTDLRTDDKEIFFIVMNDETLKETCKKHTERQEFSLGVDFYPEEWRDWRTKDFNPKITPIALARKNQIHELAVELAAQKKLTM